MCYCICVKVTVHHVNGRILFIDLYVSQQPHGQSALTATEQNKQTQMIIDHVRNNKRLNYNRSHIESGFNFRSVLTQCCDQRAALTLSSLSLL